MWCPSASLSVWANAWLAGHAAPDDVLDALSAWAPYHSVVAYDSVAAGRTGLPWPDVDAAGTMSLLQTVRTVAARNGEGIAHALPVPGDVRGLAGATQFQSDALDAGEAVLLRGADGVAIGLVPALECDEFDDSEDLPPPQMLTWSVYSLPTVPIVDHLDLGEAEYALRDAVRSAADALDGLCVCQGDEDPRTLIEEALQATSHHRIPEHAPVRAVRVLSTAAHVDAILSVSAGAASIGTQSVSEAGIATTAMRPLVTVVREARTAAVAAILRSAWDGRSA